MTVVIAEIAEKLLWVVVPLAGTYIGVKKAADAQRRNEGRDR